MILNCGNWQAFISKIKDVIYLSGKISIVIPAYNAKNTIKRCLNSIQNQSYKNLEIIVINDGSKDNTEEIVSNIAKSDNRIKLISIENGGVSHARNTGIDNATGDYITFVDSDDYIDEEMYATLIDVIQKNEADISHCSYKNVYTNGSTSVVGGKNIVVSQSNDEAINCLLSGSLFAGGLWSKLYKKNLFNDVRLLESIKYNEDILANFYLFRKCKKIIYTDKPFYNYVADETSATHSANLVKYVEQCLFVSDEMLSQSIGKSYYESAQYRCAYTVLSLYRYYLFSKDKSNSLRKKEIKKRILEYEKNNLYKSKRDKITVFIYKYLPWIYVPFYTVYDKIRVKKLDPEQ